MGNLYSNLPAVHLNSYEEIVEEVVATGAVDQSDQTPVVDSAGKISKNLTALIDPRSPTVGVSRTPVEVVAERERTRQERARRLRSLDVLNKPEGSEDTGLPGKGEGGLTVTVTTTTPTGFLDPRSPTFEYNRTPLALGSDNINNQEAGVESSPNVLDLQNDTPGKKVYDYEMSVPSSNSGQLCRDLRKRLFVAQFNEHVPVGEAEDDNKEN